MTGLISSLETTGNPSYANNHNKQKHFLICELCFWCASLLLLSTPNTHMFKNETIRKCHVCKSKRIRVIPASLRGLQVWIMLGLPIKATDIVDVLKNMNSSMIGMMVTKTIFQLIATTIFECVIKNNTTRVSWLNDIICFMFKICCVIFII